MIRCSVKLEELIETLHETNNPRILVLATLLVETQVQCNELADEATKALLDNFEPTEQISRGTRREDPEPPPASASHGHRTEVAAHPIQRHAAITATDHLANN